MTTIKQRANTAIGAEGRISMMTSIQGIYRNGKVELAEQPENMREETPVIVTFLQPNEFDLRTYGIDEIEAAKLRAGLSPFAEDWNKTEMDIYNDYDAAKTSR